MKTNRHFFKLIIILILLTTCFNTSANELIEGVWEGNFINHLGKRYKIKYNVSYKTKDEKQTLQIEMINLDLEPKPEYTYQLVDINLQDENLEFKIPRKHDTKQCTLSQIEDSKYSGECLSDKARNGETSQISMIPPTAEPGDPKAEEKIEENPPLEAAKKESVAEQ